MRLLPTWPRSYESRVEKKFGRDLRYAFVSWIMQSHPRIFLRILARRDQALERYLVWRLAQARDPAGISCSGCSPGFSPVC